MTENVKNIYYFLIVITMIILSEIGAYFWHRIAAHSNILPLVKNTHDIHHNIIDDEAHLDFIYICILLLLFFIFLCILYVYEIISITIGTIIYLPVLLTFTWNWYIHSAYHCKDHWLNSYNWFLNDKRIHMHHHINQNENYGIATHFTDELLNTFNYGFPLTYLE
jgi:sterol desaturase/sphingolipid hydroxylase (fatty acid hydroxylase superfamily)